MPYLGPDGRIAYPGGVISKGGAIEYFLTGPNVASVRIGTHLSVTRAANQVSGGRSRMRFLSSCGLARDRPPWFPTGQLGLPHGAKTLSVVAVGRTEHPYRSTGARSRSGSRQVLGTTEKPPSGACALTAPSSYKPFRGTTAVRLEPNPDVEGAALTSCLSVDYKVAATTLTTAVLVNAKSPRSAPPTLFGASAVTGRPGFVYREEDTGLHTSMHIAFTARRDGNAWVVVEGGRGFAQRIHALRSLHVARIQFSGSDRSSG